MAAVVSVGATSLLGFPKPNKCQGFPKSRPCSKLHDAFRLVDKIALQSKNRVPIVYASNTNSPNPDSGKGKGDNSSSSSDGPPLLTILAGVLVFLIVCWVIGSVVMWLVSLIVNVPPS
ncbi:uncharacterized protein LOC120249448 [Dioscorea cayenensis subsp. rotundata]|uniref:Uncharacterized protein LOC120249448 n=1 Tax=Dioscorea cayennensis subsp. rotundata TaxID=55577 RepID=A0AB40AGE6_DIOCR|nr:uncharacterized protein LOC120249448 [Dioscorea cayenensis subsp. rotundata]